MVWLGRYPVKSMLGEDLIDVDVEPTGFAGDRRCALVDAGTGLVASAKNPRKWRRLLSMYATLAPDGRVTVTLPGGATVRDDDPLLDERLSGVLGRPVRFARSRPDDARLERLTPDGEPSAGVMTTGSLGAGTFVDFAAVHVVTTSTLAALGGADARRFRPNVVVRMLDDRPFTEHTWRGVSLGPDAALTVVAPTPRCAIPTLAQGTELVDDPEILRTAARLNRIPVFDMGNLTCVGGYASVANPGRVRVGDRVRVA